MFDPKSRYYRSPDIYYTAADGTRIAYTEPRLPAQASTFVIQGVVTVGPVDRLDTVTARTLGDPETYWRIADCNNALDPFDLAVPGRKLKIPAARL